MFLGLCVFIRYDNARQANVIKAELAVSLAEHVAECPARARAFSDPDDSGSSPTARGWSASGRLVQP